MKKTPLLPVLAAIVLASPALAVDMPVYAVDNHCQARWRSDAKMKNVCIRQQQASYNALKASWTSIPAKIAQDCRGQWDQSNDYVMLQFCIEQQVLAAGNAAAFNPN